MTDARILVTGANGFVGWAVCDVLLRKGHALRRVTRGGVPEQMVHIDHPAETAEIGSLGPNTDWTQALKYVQCVIHLAARAHIMREETHDALPVYRTINVAGTEKLARDAAAAGVQRLVFLSSIKVNGERTPDGPFTEADMPRPEDAYGTSKWVAEQSLWKIAADTGLEVVALRAPLVYGPGVKGKFLRLMNLVARKRPLPLASICNKRSLVFLGNHVDALIVAKHSPAAAGQTYLVSDGEDMSTPELIRGIAKALDVPPRLLPLPASLLRACGVMLGKKGETARLTDSLQIDSSRIRRDLGWRPSYSVEQGLEETGRWYLKAVNGEQGGRSKEPGVRAV
jgi:nucleoside-diphosphate-sugar epimerase